MPAFVDTDVLIYAVVGEQHERTKRDTARQLLRSEGRVLSYQVLVEFYHQTTRRGRANALTHKRASQYIVAFSRFRFVPGSLDLTMAGLAIREQTNYSIWDCMIIAAAKAGGCDTLLSEDMDHDRTVAGVRIVNPFAEAA